MQFIECVLTDSDRQRLQDAEVEFTEHVIGTATHHLLGITFRDHATETVVDLLGLIRDYNGDDNRVCNPVTRDYFYHMNEDVRSVPLLLPPQAGEAPLLVNSWRRFGRSRDQDLSEISRSMGMGLIIRRAHDSAPFAYRAGQLMIHVNGHPPGTSSEILEQGFEGCSRYRRVIGPTRDFVVVRNDSGRYIALFQGDAAGGTLWLLFDFDDCGSPMEILKYVLHALAQNLNPDLGAVLTYAEYLRLAGQRAYIAHARDRLRADLQELPRQAARTTDRVREIQGQLVAALRDQQLAVLRQAEPVRSEDELIAELVLKMEQEFANLSGSPDFESILFEGRSIVAVTRPIEITWRGNIYSYGRYKLTCTTDAIQIFSVDRPLSGEKSHPHINGTSPCFGNMTQTMAKLLAERRYGELLPLLVIYLERGYDPAGAYVTIDSCNVPVRPVQEANHVPALATS